MAGEFSGKRAVVMGLGRFGGGVGAARWLCEQGARVLVTDLAGEADLRESIDALGDLHITYRLGGHDEADLTNCDLLVVSPAVNKQTSDFFRSAVSRGIPWTSEMTLFLERCRCKIVGITGTAGKSTTTAMLGSILESAAAGSAWRHGRVRLGGNIGKSLLDESASIEADDIVVLELSSFQLEDAARLRRSPAVALVTNFADNHLDRHGTSASYAEAKANIYRFQEERDWLVMPRGCGEERLPGDWQTRQRLYRIGPAPESGGIQLVCRDEVREWTDIVPIALAVPGRHNVRNAACALAAARILEVSDEVALKALGTFKGLAHRLEFVTEHRGVRFYNDSKATTPEAAVTSLQAFEAPIVALVGGSDKGMSYDDFGQALARRAKAVICMGDMGPAIGRAVERARGHADMPIVKSSDDFRAAIRTAESLANAGDVVLLSPGCASFDWFRNYEERGEKFREWVLQGSGRPAAVR